MKFDNTSNNFIEQLKEAYCDKIIKVKKTTEEVIEYCKEAYGLIPMSDIEGLDYLGISMIDNIKNLLNVVDDSKIKFKIFRLEENYQTKKFYQYYNDRFYGNLRVYVYHEVFTDKLFSNCELFELKLSLLRGVDKLEIQNETRNYIEYLNNCYLYYENCSE